MFSKSWWQEILIFTIAALCAIASIKFGIVVLGGIAAGLAGPRIGRLTIALATGSGYIQSSEQDSRLTSLAEAAATALLVLGLTWLSANLASGIICALFAGPAIYAVCESRPILSVFPGAISGALSFEIAQVIWFGLNDLPLSAHLFGPIAGLATGVALSWALLVTRRLFYSEETRASLVMYPILALAVCFGLVLAAGLDIAYLDWMAISFFALLLGVGVFAERSYKIELKGLDEGVRAVIRSR